MPETWLSGPASLQAQALAELGWVLLISMSAVFVLTMALLALALRRGPKRRLPPALWIAGLGVAFPATGLSALLGYSVWRTAGLERAPADPLVVSVVGRSWWWELQYRDPASGRWFAAANELRLPAGRPVHLGLASEDVIHSLWAPALGGKMDLVPGRTNRLVFTATEAGVWRAPCAEYCGAQHARMALTVVVMPEADWTRWLAAQARPAADEVPAQAEGREAFVRHCGGCHVVRGVTAGPGLPVTLGPDLTHVGSRLHIAAGVLPNGREALARWIADPQAFKPGARMPGFAHLGQPTLDSLAAYLVSLQ